MTPHRARAFVAATALALAVPFTARAQGLPPPPPPPVPPSLTPAPSATAVPGQTTPAPFPSPSPFGSPGAPIRVDRARVGVVPGASVVVHVNGGSGPLTIVPSFSGVDATFDPVTRTLTLAGVAFGRGTVTIADAAGENAIVNVLVGPPAGAVPPDVGTVALANGATPQFVASRLQAAIASAAQLQPGATVSVTAVHLLQQNDAVYPGHRAPLGPLHAGDTALVTASVTLHGNDQTVDVTGSTTAHVTVASLPPIEPLLLFYSDDPESLGPLDDGVLFRDAIDATRVARVYAYHVSVAGIRRQIYLAFAPSAGAAGVTHVQVLGAAAGPSDAFPYVGHVSTLRYLLEHATQESYVATIAPGAPSILALGAGPMLPAQLTAAIYDVRVLDGPAVDVSVVAASNGADPTQLLTQPEHPSDGHFRRGEFSLANVAPIALSFAAGGPEPQPFAVGARYAANGEPYFPNLRADVVAQGGQRAPLAGDYGVLRTVQLQLANPTAVPQNVYLYETPGANGGVTTTMWFTGDAAPTEVKCVSDPSQRYLVKGWGLAPGQSLTVTGQYMTDGTSFYPLLFGLTTTPPHDPPINACGPKPGV